MTPDGAQRPLIRCRPSDEGVIEYCREVTARQAAAADAIAVGCWHHAEQLAARASLIAEVHAQEIGLREGRR